jgi:hypothetical protein
MATGITSLNNMSVKTDGNAGMLMPKLQFRFRVSLLNFGNGGTNVTNLTRQVIDCSRPNVSFAEIPIQVYNSTIKIAGKHTWTDMTLNIRDDASNQVQQLVASQLQKQLDFYEQASAASAQDYKFETTVEILDGGNGAFTPTAIETWQLYGCFLKTANYNTLNYGTNEAVTISLTITYDNAVQLPSPNPSPVFSGNYTGTAVGAGTN